MGLRDFWSFHPVSVTSHSAILWVSSPSVMALAEHLVTSFKKRKVFSQVFLIKGLSVSWVWSEEETEERGNIATWIWFKGGSPETKPCPMGGTPQRKSWVDDKWRKGGQEEIIMARVKRKMKVSSNIAESVRQRMTCVLGVWALFWKLIWSPLGRWCSYNSERKGHGVSNQQSIARNPLQVFRARAASPPPSLPGII